MTLTINIPPDSQGSQESHTGRRMSKRIKAFLSFSLNISVYEGQKAKKFMSKNMSGALCSFLMSKTMGATYSFILLLQNLA